MERRGGYGELVFAAGFALLTWVLAAAVLLAIRDRAVRPVLLVQGVVLIALMVIVFVAVTYLGYHWITDCVAGVLLGLALRLGLRRLPLE